MEAPLLLVRVQGIPRFLMFCSNRCIFLGQGSLQKKCGKLVVEIESRLSLCLSPLSFAKITSQPYTPKII